MATNNLKDHSVLCISNFIDPQTYKLAIQSKNLQKLVH